MRTANQGLKKKVDSSNYDYSTKNYSVPAVTNPDGTTTIPAQPVYGVDPNHDPVDHYLAVRTVPGGTIKEVAAAVTTAVAPTLTCPAGKRWIPLSFICDWTASATVGNRILVPAISANGQAATDWRGASTAAITAAQIGGYDIGFGPPLSTPSTTVRRCITAAANTNVQVRENTSITQISAGGYVTISDITAVDVADQCAYRFVYLEFDA